MEVEQLIQDMTSYIEKQGLSLYFKPEQQIGDKHITDPITVVLSIVIVAFLTGFGNKLGQKAADTLFPQNDTDRVEDLKKYIAAIKAEQQKRKYSDEDLEAAYMAGIKEVETVLQSKMPKKEQKEFLNEYEQKLVRLIDEN